MINNRYAAAVAGGLIAVAAAFGPIEAQEQPEQVRVPTAVLARYVGDYVHPDGNIVKLRLAGDTLFEDLPTRRTVLVPLSDTLFRWGPIFTMEFVTDKTGGLTLILASAVVELRLPRRGSRAVPPPPITPVKVPRSVLERYVGTYEYIPGQMGRTDLRVVIRLDGDKLIRQTGREDIVLEPISETRFRPANTSRIIEFVVDDAGVTQVFGFGFQQLVARLTSR